MNGDNQKRKQPQEKEPLDDVADIQKKACARMNTDLFKPTWAIPESAAFFRLPAKSPWVYRAPYSHGLFAASDISDI